MATKKCKQCAMEIPKEAKICPHCRSKQGLKSWQILLILIFILAVIGRINKQDTSNGPVSSNPSLQGSQSLTSTQDSAHLTEKGKKVKAKHPEWSNEVCNMISQKKVYIGMPREQVIAAWGKPHKINTTHLSDSTHEQWVMSDSIESSYLYFDDGKLTSIQTSR